MRAADSLPVYEFDASRGRFAYAWRDAYAAFSNWPLIVTLVRQDILNRYRGAALGGFWITLTTLATVSGLALLYGQIFAADFRTYFPFVAIGIVVWGLISSLINEATSAFIAGSAMIGQSPLPKTLLAIRSVFRSLWTLAFKSVIVIGVLIFTGANPGLEGIVLSVLGILMIVWSGFFCTLALGVIAARFRDLGQLVDVGLTFAFFITPVFWRPERLGEYQHLIAYNPLYHYLNIVRGSLIGAPDLGLSFLVAAAFTVFVTMAGVMVFGRFSQRLPYWC